MLIRQNYEVMTPTSPWTDTESETRPSDTGKVSLIVSNSSSSSSQCFHRLSNVSTSHKREEEPRLRGRGMSRIKKFKSRGNFRAVEKKYPLQFENYKSVTGKCRIVFCKNIYGAKMRAKI